MHDGIENGRRLAHARMLIRDDVRWSSYLRGSPRIERRRNLVSSELTDVHDYVRERFISARPSTVQSFIVVVAWDVRLPLSYRLRGGARSPARVNTPSA